MLYDPKREKKTETKSKPKPKRLSVAGMIVWLEQQPPSKEYSYLSNDNCLVCQYLRSLGVKRPRAGGEYWRVDGSWEKNPLPAAIQDIASEFPYTFGAALERARAIAASR